MNCNFNAFVWVIEVIKISTKFRDSNRLNEPEEVDYSDLSSHEKKTMIEDKMNELTDENCLNILVTSHFLKVSWLYERVWDEYIQDHFSQILNQC